MNFAGVISGHDLDVIHRSLATVRYRLAGVRPIEVQVSERRLSVDGLVAFGIPVRRRGDLGLNDLLIVVDGHEPIPFSFED